jgi:hypothetical protein
MIQFPGYHVGLGFGFFVLGLAVKDNLPQAIGSLPIIQLPCAFFSSVFIPLGALLALRGLIFEKFNQRSLLGYHLLGLLFIPVILSLYFYSFVMTNWMIDLPNQLQMPTVLPKLIENARSFPTEEKRKTQAQWAYRMYGVVVAYPLDNLETTYYVPTEDDKDYWQKNEKIKAQTNASMTALKKLMNQWPYLFGLYAATFTATFALGWIWLILRLPKDLKPVST